MGKFRFNLITTVSGASFVCCLLMFFGEMQVSHCIEIRRLSVPRWVQNGTEDYIILDCEYVYNENDLRLVVKWFFDDITEPVYQWIPELNNRYTSGILKGRLDLNFSITTVDVYSKYRALRILNPSTELSGKYTCEVISLAGVDTRDQVMTVYVPANEFELSYTELSDSLVNVTCEAQGLFPPPILKLYVGSSIGSPLQTVTDVTKISRPRFNGAYDAYLYRTFNASELTKTGTSSVFECTVELPGTNYSKAKRIAYFPGLRNDPAYSVSSISHTRSSSWYLVIGSTATICIFRWFIHLSVITSEIITRTSYNNL